MEFKYKFIMKEGIIIKFITKNEAIYLRQAGYSRYVNNGHGTYKNIYIVENKNVLKVLNDHRELIRNK
jgi:hypothetical protein